MDVSNRLQKPLPAGTLLTRYVDIHGFLYFITQGKLRFARLDTFEDLNEGFSTQAAPAVKKISEHTRQATPGNTEEMLQHVAKLKDHHSELEQQYRYHQQRLFACCWYMGEKESVAMWNLYSNPDSVAVRVDAAVLIGMLEEIARAGEQHFNKLAYGPVEYIDLAAADDREAPEAIGFYKDNSFSHEHEFRFLAEQSKHSGTLEFELALGNLKQIDFQVISHPKMEQWKIRNILNVLDCYELADRFLPSGLALKNI